MKKIISRGSKSPEHQRAGRRARSVREPMIPTIRFPIPGPADCRQYVPYSARTMWVHAYQSFVWNSMASARLREYGPRAVPGDLLLPFPDAKSPATSTMPMGISTSPDSRDGASLGEGSRGLSSAGGKEGGGGASAREGVRVLTAQDMEAFSREGVTAEALFARVVLPLPGTSVQYPAHKVSVILPTGESCLNRRGYLVLSRSGC